MGAIFVPRIAAFVLAFSVFLTTLASAEQQVVTASTVLPKSFKSEKTGFQRPHWRYLLYLPSKYSEGSEKWPLMIFLHGRSIRGTDISMVKRYGPPSFLDKTSDFPFVVVSPQLPDQSWPTDSLLDLVDEVTARYRVDPDRVYLTGVSMGGGGTWATAAADRGKRFAAIAPLCGYGTPAITDRVTKVPIWAFHGDADRVTPLGPHERLIEAVNQAGGSATITVIPDGTHGNIIYPTYKRDDLYDWLLANSRGSNPVMPGDLVAALPKDPVAISPPPTGTYQVRKGDTLWSISHRHGLSVEALKKANGLGSNVIQIGQRLRIPKS